MKNKNISAIKFASILFIIIYMFSFIAKYAFSIHFLYGSIDLILLIFFITSIFFLLVFVIKYSKKLKILKILFVSLVLIISLLLFAVNTMFSFLNNKVIMKNTSPSGRNTLVVLEGGFIDATYEAYPIKGLFFYKWQNNGFVSNHDDWGGAKITVSWENENKAIVKIHSDFHPNQNSNQNNEIVVIF